jgi:hypothetical protein
MAFPGTYNFDYYRGDTFQFLITPKTSAGATFALDSYAASGAIFTISSARGDSPSATINSVDDSDKLSATINTSTDVITCLIKPNAREDQELLEGARAPGGPP